MTNTVAPYYNYDLSADLALTGRGMEVRVDGMFNNDRHRSLYFAQNISFSFSTWKRTANFDVQIKFPYKVRSRPNHCFGDEI